jgi:hypothetical protein
MISRRFTRQCRSHLLFFFFNKLHGIFNDRVSLLLVWPEITGGSHFGYSADNRLKLILRELNESARVPHSKNCCFDSLLAHVAVVQTAILVLLRVNFPTYPSKDLFEHFIFVINNLMLEGLILILVFSVLLLLIFLNLELHSLAVLFVL